jgi:hypothetical protein
MFGILFFGGATVAIVLTLFPSLMPHMDHQRSYPHRDVATTKASPLFSWNDFASKALSGAPVAGEALSAIRGATSRSPALPDEAYFPKPKYNGSYFPPFPELKSLL